MRFIPRCRHFESNNCRNVTIHRSLTTDKETHHQIPDSGYFCTHRRFEPMLSNRTRLLRRVRRSASVLNNLQLEYS